VAVFAALGGFLLLISACSLLSWISLVGNETSVMHQQYGMMNLILWVLSLIGAFLMFGVCAILKAIQELHPQTVPTEAIAIPQAPVTSPVTPKAEPSYQSLLHHEDQP
jgi:hypothetical protein